MSTEQSLIATVARLEERSEHHQSTHERTIARLHSLEERVDRRFEEMEGRATLRHGKLIQLGHQVTDLYARIEGLAGDYRTATDRMQRLDGALWAAKTAVGILLMAAAFSGWVGPDGAKAGRALLGMP